MGIWVSVPFQIREGGLPSQRKLAVWHCMDNARVLRGQWLEKGAQTKYLWRENPQSVQTRAEKTVFAWTKTHVDYREGINITPRPFSTRNPRYLLQTIPDCCSFLSPPASIDAEMFRTHLRRQTTTVNNCFSITLPYLHVFLLPHFRSLHAAAYVCFPHCRHKFINANFLPVHFACRTEVGLSQEH